jgi:hypothetical protein
MTLINQTQIFARAENSLNRMAALHLNALKRKDRFEYARYELQLKNNLPRCQFEKIKALEFEYRGFQKKAA